MAEDLWKLRQRKGMTVQQLAAKSGIPVAVIQEYEAGKRPIRSADLPKLARALFV
ncbi:MAG: XRE family transcriptional regulator, partial [Chloroflexota bacterium]